MKKILFVCLGNICRSPAAHAILQQKLHEAGLSELITVDSAGTADYHRGELPDARMRKHGAQRGYQINSLARQLSAEDGKIFDLILLMDNSNLKNARHIIPAAYHHKLNLLLDYVNEPGYREVPDPYYQGPEGFKLVLDLLESACNKLLSACLKSYYAGQ